MVAIRYVTHGSAELLLASLAFIFAVLFSAMAGGWKPGLAATVLCIWAAIFLFTKPYYTFRVTDPADVIPLLAYFVSGVAISLLCEGLLVAGRGLSKGSGGWRRKLPNDAGPSCRSRSKPNGCG